MGGVTYEAVGLQGSGAAPRALLMAAFVGRPPEAAPIALRRTDGLRHCGESSERGGGQRPKNPPVDPPRNPPVPTLLAIIGSRPPAVPTAALVARGACGTEHRGSVGGGVVGVRVGSVWGVGSAWGGGSVWGHWGVWGRCGVCMG